MTKISDNNIHEKCPIQIRLATFEDLSMIQSCARTAYTKYVERIGQEPAPMIADFASQIELGRAHVAFYRSSFAGYIVFYREVDHLHLENVAVLPIHSGKGIGKQLIEYVEHTAQNNGLNAVELYTNEAMFENLTMYSKLGYVEINRNKQDGFNRVFFRKLV